ncbi:MAG: NAD(P)/FAD-dependent oxidoreductase [Bacteriovoracaceae bacterium]
MYDVIIVGGGPAGLSAALILGRCLRKVLICDSGRPRNAWSHGMHCFISRDGVDPFKFLSLCHQDLKKYETVEYLFTEVTQAKKIEDGFEITTTAETVFRAKKLLIATGVIDNIPKLEGIVPLYGKSVFTCPYCDAWEQRGKRILIYGKSARGKNLSLTLKNWSEDILLITDGDTSLSEEDREILKLNGIWLNEKKVKALKGEKGQLTAVEFEDGECIERDAMFFNTESWIRSRLLEQLGCPFDEKEGVPTDKYERTKVPGLYVAGNILREVQLVIVAAAEGAEAAFGINTALSKEDVRKPTQKKISYTVQRSDTIQ